MNQSFKQSKSQSARLSVIAACAVLFVLGSAEAGQAQQTASPKMVASAEVGAPATAHALPKPAAEDEEPTKPAKAAGEGIKVHGHWKLDVRNPDGKLVKTYEFENSLVTPNSGDFILSYLLAGQAAVAGWEVLLNSSTNTGTLCASASTANFSGCVLVPTGTTSSTLTEYYFGCAYSSCTPALTVTAVPWNVTTNAASYLQLQGSVTVPNAGTINSVATAMAGCATGGMTTNISNVACNVYNPSSTATGYAPAGTVGYQASFTSTTLPTALSVTAGQVVTVTVTISFS
jgi:hypothetical protein